MSGAAAKTDWRPEGWRRTTTQAPLGCSRRLRWVPIGTRPSDPIFSGVRRLQTQGHQGQETKAVEAEGRTQLGESVRGFGEEEGVVIDIELQGAAVRQEGRREEIQIGEQKFTVVEFGADKKPAAIVEQVEHGEIEGATREPVVGGGIELPEFADLRTLPTADRSQGFTRGRAMGMAVLPRPVAHLGAIRA